VNYVLGLCCSPKTLPKKLSIKSQRVAYRSRERSADRTHKRRANYPISESLTAATGDLLPVRDMTPVSDRRDIAPILNDFVIAAPVKFVICVY